MWWVYIIESVSGFYYTGVTTDINNRFRQHNREIKGGAKFFRRDPPSLVIYMQNFRNRSEAQQCEAQIKKLSRKQKEELIFTETYSQGL